jgi:hypothetical protein
MQVKLMRIWAIVTVAATAWLLWACVRAPVV